MDHALDVYMPMDRRQALANGGTLPERTRGAALFADISGFMPLTEALARALGPQRGVEELTHHLNQAYDPLISAVHSFGGSVLGFSGDAITSWFDGDDGRRATAAALAMQQAMRPLARVPIAGQATAALALKAAVASGPARRFLVGDPSIHLIDVLAGATMLRVAAAEDLADAGEVVLDWQTAARLSTVIDVAEWRTPQAESDESASQPTGQQAVAVVRGLRLPVHASPWPDVSSQSLDTSRLRPWLLPAVADRLLAGQGEFLTELRPAVALFLHFEGIDYDGDPDAGQKLDAYVRWVQSALARVEGTLIQLTVGEKGSYLYAILGAPLAHEDDARRAVSVALELSTPPSRLDFIRPARVGISRGTMRAGAYGGAARRAYGVLGDEANVAARLMQRAQPGQVLLSERVRQAADDWFAWEALPAVSIKGRATPVAVYRLLGEKKTAVGTPGRPGHHGPARPWRRSMETPPGRIVGRAAERQVLARVLSEAERGVSGVVVVEGEAGIGKTRLVAELLAQARNLGLPTLTGSGDAVERAAYHGWRDIVAALLGLDPTADAATQARQARQALQPQDQERAPLLRDVLPLELPEDDLTRQMTGQVRADNTRRLLVGLMQAASAGAPKVVVLEDAHWLDSASWALALQVSQQVGPLLLVVVQRPMSDPWPPEYADLLTGAGTLRLQLGPLPADDGRALVCQRLGVTSLPEAVAVLIQSRAEGNPFFSQELGYALRDAGLIQVIDGTCRLAPDVDLTQLAFPDTVQGVITSRIDRLMPTQQLTLKVASVIGRIFAYRLLRAIYPVEADKPQLGECLQALERLDLTALESAEPDLAYIFKHIITQEVAYNLMLFAQRQALHQAIVDWHERTTGDLTPIYPLLAYHCSKAEMPAKAIDYLEKAGEQAAMRYANREAIDLFSRALALEAEAAKAARGASVPGAAHPKDGRLRRARWERQLGQATMGTGDLLRARGHLRNALKLLGRPEAQGPVGLVLGLLGQGLRQTLHRLRPGRWVGRLEDGADAEAVREAAGAYEHLGEIYYLSNDTLRMVHAGLRTLNLAERLAPSPLLARAYGIACVIAGAVPVHGLARAYGRRARQVVRRQSHLPSLTLVLLANGLYHIGVGDWARAENGFRQALEIADRLGDRSRWAENLILTEQVQYFRGSYARGAELADDLAAQAATSGNRLHQAWALSGRAESWLRLGRTAEAAADLIAALTLYSENSDRTSEITSYGLLALAQLRQGDASAARQAAESGAERMAALGSPTSHYLLEGYAGVAETFLMLWENLGSPGRHPFYKSARQACSALKGYARIFPIGQPRAWVCQGWLDWQRGRASRARRAWTRALTAAERLGMPYELGWAHYQFGRHLPAADPARRLHLARACEAFARLGATGDLERARAEAS